MTTISGSASVDLRREVRLQIDASERAHTRAIGRAISGLQAALRREVRAAGLGGDLAKAWRGQKFPRRGQSLNAAGMVWSKSRRIHDAFARGGTVRAQSAGWLVIPTDQGEALGLDQNSTRSARGAGQPRGDANVDAATRRFGRLRFVRIAPDKALLLAPGRGPRKADLPLFFLVKQVQSPQLLDPGRVFQRWSDRVPRLIDEELRRAR